MKKYASVLLMLLIVFLSCFSASAAGINRAEKRVLECLRQIKVIDDKDTIIPAPYVNQAEAYFNTIDMTDAQADEIIGYLYEAYDIFMEDMSSTFNQLTIPNKFKILILGQNACNVLGLTLTQSQNWAVPQDDIWVTIVDGTGSIVFHAVCRLYIPNSGISGDGEDYYETDTDYATDSDRKSSDTDSDRKGSSVVIIQPTGAANAISEKAAVDLSVSALIAIGMTFSLILLMCAVFLVRNKRCENNG